MTTASIQKDEHTGGSLAQREITLQEWEQRDVRLSPAEIADLLKCPTKVLKVHALPGGTYRLRPEAFVGQLRFGTIDIRILPKFPMPSLLAMLSEVYDMAQLTPALVGYDTSGEVVDLLIRIFLRQVECVVRQGLRRTYVQNDEEMVAVRGRIDLQPTVNLHLRGKARVQCRYEDYTLDGPENGTLLAALRTIAATPMLPVERRNLARRIAAEFSGVRPVFPQTTEPGLVELDRLNQHYYPALPLANLILRCTGVTQDFGKTEGNSFLLNMNQLFEKFVYRKLRKILNYDRVVVREQVKFPFDFEEQSDIKPDLIIENWRGQRIVADTKYKIGTRPDPSDLYQMLTYCRVLKIPHGFLITVGSGEPRRYQVRDGQTSIDVVPINLGGSLADIDKSMSELSFHLLNVL